MKTSENQIVFEPGQVVSAWSVGVMVLVMLVLVAIAAFSSSCTRDMWVEPSFADEGDAVVPDDDAYNSPMPEEDASSDAYAEGDCSGPWGCKAYADLATLPPECEDDDGCADGFVCNNEGECVPEMPEPDVSEDIAGEVEQGLYPLEVATQPDTEEQPACHCGVGYYCEDGMCVKVGGNDNSPNDNPPNEEEDASSFADAMEDKQPEPQPEPDVVAQTEDVAPQPTEDVVADSASPEASQSEPADAAAQDAESADAGASESADVVAEIEADVAEADETAEALGAVPEVVADGGAVELFNGAKCTISCLPEYTMIRVWWAFTSADVANGTEFSIPKTQMCLWGEMAFEFNCFIPDGKWGDYLKATVSCQPDDYELEDTGIHGKVKFDESCW